MIRLPEDFQVRDKHGVYQMARDPEQSDRVRTVFRPVARFKRKVPPPDPNAPAGPNRDPEGRYAPHVREFVEAMLADQDVEDEALDFIEAQVGRYQFPDNWVRDREKFLPVVNRMPNGDAILAEIDRLAAEGATWDDLRRKYVLEPPKIKKPH